MTSSKRLRTVGIWLGIPLVFCSLTALWVVHDLRTLKFSFFSERDASSLITAIKGAAAQVVVVRRPSDQRSSPDSLKTHEINSRLFQADAKLFDAWTSQVKIGQEALKSTTTGDWTRSSVALKDLAGRVDPWQHNLCLLRRGDVLAVISGGPNVASSPICRDIKISEHELSRLPRGRLLETPAGNLLLVMGKVPISAVPASQ